MCIENYDIDAGWLNICRLYEFVKRIVIIWCTYRVSWDHSVSIYAISMSVISFIMQKCSVKDLDSETGQPSCFVYWFPHPLHTSVKNYLHCELYLVFRRMLHAYWMAWCLSNEKYDIYDRLIAYIWENLCPVLIIFRRFFLVQNDRHFDTLESMILSTDLIVLIKVLLKNTWITVETINLSTYEIACSIHLVPCHASIHFRFSMSDKSCQVNDETQ